MKELLRIGRKCKNEVPDSVKKYKVLDTVHSKRPTTLGWWNSARWKNNWANFMCIKCKENIAHTRTSARYNWSKNIRELILIKIYTEKNIHSITIWLFQSRVLKVIVNEILTFQSCTSLVHKRWWRRWREQQWTRSWTWKFGMDGPVGYNY